MRPRSNELLYFPPTQGPSQRILYRLKSGYRCGSWDGDCPRRLFYWCRSKLYEQQAGTDYLFYSVPGAGPDGGSVLRQTGFGGPITDWGPGPNQFFVAAGLGGDGYGREFGIFMPFFSMILESLVSGQEALNSEASLYTLLQVRETTFRSGTYPRRSQRRY